MKKSIIQQIQTALCFLFFTFYSTIFNVNAQTVVYDSLFVSVETAAKQAVVCTDVWLIEQKTGDTLKGVTDTLGKVAFSALRGEKYRVLIKDAAYKGDLTFSNMFTKVVVLTSSKAGKKLSDIATDSIVQTLPYNQKQTRTQMLLRFLLQTPQNKPLPNFPMVLYSAAHKRAYTSYSDAKGNVRFLVPPGRYVLQLEGFDFKTFDVVYDAGIVTTSVVQFYATDVKETEKNDTIVQKLPANPQGTNSRALLQIRVNDLTYKPLANEPVSVYAENAQKTYTATTGKDGKVYFLLHKRDNYIISLKYARNCLLVDFPQIGGIHRTDVNLQYKGSANIEAQALARAKAIAKQKDETKEELEKLADSAHTQTDSVILSVFRRNSQWKNTLVVTDLTGSMYPYAGQILLWYRLHLKKDETSHLVFFNDGDDKPDSQKVIGSTGGIYLCDSCNYNQMLGQMVYTVLGGNGSDVPENNIEALSVALDSIKTFKELIMIADNWAPVKDIALLNRISTPVRVIVCGVSDYIHPDYLKIAFRTGGSIHTIDQDIYNIAKLLDGQTITIGDKIYRLKNGEFVPVSKM